jgi:hypothetical protein
MAAQDPLQLAVCHALVLACFESHTEARLREQMGHLLPCSLFSSRRVATGWPYSRQKTPPSSQGKTRLGLGASWIAPAQPRGLTAARRRLDAAILAAHLAPRPSRARLRMTWNWQRRPLAAPWTEHQRAQYTDFGEQVEVFNRQGRNGGSVDSGRATGRRGCRLTLLHRHQGAPKSQLPHRRVGLLGVCLVPCGLFKVLGELRHGGVGTESQDVGITSIP